MENKPLPNPPEGQLLIYQDGAMRLQVRLDRTTVWLTQRLMAKLFQVSVPTINEHLKNIYHEGELDPDATIRQFLIVQTEGSRQVSRMVEHYNLDATTPASDFDRFVEKTAELAGEKKKALPDTRKAGRKTKREED